MLRLAHLFLVAVYFAVPVIGLFAAFWRTARSGRAGAVSGFILTAMTAVALSYALSIIYASAAGGRYMPSQIAIGAYFALAMLLILKWFDALLRAGLIRAFGLRPSSEPAASSANVPAAQGPRRRRSGARAGIAAMARVLILFAIGLPYVMATVMIYRPKVAPADDPKKQFGFDFERVEFTASDGTPLVGWWIPAAQPSPRGRWPRGRGIPTTWGAESVLVCHGLGANKSNQLLLARRLVPAGFNVLIFDFRAHGESGGQLTSFGDRERFDVLGAVHWLRERQPQRATRIFGVGASMGAAALIAAASETGEDAQSISAIAAYGAYDSLPSLVQSIGRNYFFPPGGWLVEKVSFPLASLQTGAALQSFKPGRLIQKLWPRPVLVIHGVRDEIIPFEHGQTLYDDAVLPRYHLWIDREGHNEVVANDDAAAAVVEFFRVAADVPLI